MNPSHFLHHHPHHTEVTTSPEVGGGAEVEETSSTMEQQQQQQRWQYSYCVLLSLTLLGVTQGFVLQPLSRYDIRLARPSSSSTSAPFPMYASLPRHFRNDHPLKTNRIVHTGLSASSLPSGPRGGGNSGTDGGRVTSNLVSVVKSLYFPLTVLAAGVLGAVKPEIYAGLSDAFVTRALAGVMVS